MEQGTLLRLMAPAGTQGLPPPGTARHCQEYEPGLGNKWAMGPGPQCSWMSQEKGTKVRMLNSWVSPSSGGEKGVPPPQFSKMPTRG